MSIRGCPDDGHVLSTYNEMLLSFKEGQSDTGYNVDEPGKGHDAP